MTYDELNSFIYNYLQYDRTYRALMLTGEWGTGKSHYIKNDLISFLENSTPKYKCTIVSLYGINSLLELSKAIYVESRRILNDSTSESVNNAIIAGKIIGRTIFNGLVSKIGFDIGSIKEEDLQKVYESLDFSERLIVLEDVERAKIDIAELFGYVNNLCEYDHARVLLVANENEFIKIQPADVNNTAKSDYSKESREYLRKKEKTVCDTIKFECDYEAAISNIINKDFICLKKYDTTEYILEILNIHNRRRFNLRSFIVACQKTEDILEYLGKNHVSINPDTEKVIFFGIVGFIQKRDIAKYMSINNNSSILPDMGANNQYPLFKFCYDYITLHRFPDVNKIRKADLWYIEYCKNSKWNSGKDRDLVVIKNFYVNSENDLIDAINNIFKKIEKGIIPYYDYGILANYLVAIQYDVGIDSRLDEFEALMVKSLHERNVQTAGLDLFTDRYDFENKNGTIRFAKFRTSLEKAIAGFDDSDVVYEPERFVELCEKYKGLRFRNLGEKEIFKIDSSKFIDMLKICDPKQLDIIRAFIQDIYVIDKRYELDSIGELVEIYNWICEEQFEEFDKTKKLQMRWMQNMLETEIRNSQYEIRNKETDIDASKINNA